MNRRDFLSTSVKAWMVHPILTHFASAEEKTETPKTTKAFRLPAGVKVPTKRLGKTDIETPILIMGCCQNLDPVYDRKLHRAFELGVNHLDTAQMYAEGQSHKTIAPFIKQIGDRKKLIIASKVHLSENEATPEKFIHNLELSLKDLETDYLDIFYMHIVRHERLLDKEFIEMGEKLKKEGKIRFFGFSAHHGNAPDLMLKASQLGGGIDVIMVKYSFREFGKDKLEKALDECKKAGIGIIAMKTLGSIPDDAEEIVPWTTKDFTKVQAKLKAVWEDERIDAIASQMESVQHVNENAYAAISPKKISDEARALLRKIAEKTESHYCSGCSHYCGLADGTCCISDVWRCLLYAEGYKNRNWARYYSKNIRLDAFIEKLSEDKLILAKKRCPHQIDITNLINKTRTILG